MPSILPLIFSLLFLGACARHELSSKGRQGVAETITVKVDERLQFVLDENVEALDKLALDGGDLEAELPNGKTLFTEACSWPKPKVIEFLLQRKVSVETKDRFGMSPLDYADADEAIKRLLFPDLEGMEQRKNIFLAVQSNDMTALKQLLDEGPSLNFYLDDGETLLTYCVKNNRFMVLRLLGMPKYGMDVNLPNKNGETALALSRHRELPMIEKLLRMLGATE